jgi:hypothetical protein
VPAVILCGRTETGVDIPPEVVVASLEERFGPEAAMERAGPLLERLAFEVAPLVEQTLRAPER